MRREEEWMQRGEKVGRRREVERRMEELWSRRRKEEGRRKKEGMKSQVE